MRLNSNAYFANMTMDDLAERYKRLGEVFDSCNGINILRENLKQMERTRHIQLWHDGSDIVSHGHILFSVNMLYDTAVFYTSEEYEQLFHEKVDIQLIVETPEVYIFGRCGSNDEQLAYAKTRLECLQDIQAALFLEDIDANIGQIHLIDIMRFFHGDGPSVQIEAGNQKGGSYFCPNCLMHHFPLITTPPPPCL